MAGRDGGVAVSDTQQFGRFDALPHGGSLNQQELQQFLSVRLVDAVRFFFHVPGFA